MERIKLIVDQCAREKGERWFADENMQQKGTGQVDEHNENASSSLKDKLWTCC